jgi:hypothetical protein
VIMSPMALKMQTTIHCQKKPDILILISDFFWQCIVGCILNAVMKYPVCVLHYCNLCHICAFGDKDGILRTLVDCTFFDRRQTQKPVWRELICRDTMVFYIT